MSLNGNRLSINSVEVNKKKLTSLQHFFANLRRWITFILFKIMVSRKKKQRNAHLNSRIKSLIDKEFNSMQELKKIN